MEFKLNKIDTDIRRRLQENIREGKVHGNNTITIKKDLKEERSKKYIKKDKQNKFNSTVFVIDGVRYEEKSLEIEAEKIEFIDAEKLKGHTLDVKK